MSEVAVKKVTYVFGVDVTTMSKDLLVNAIRRLDQEIKAVSEVAKDAGSRYLDKQLEELISQKKAVVAMLDEGVAE